RPQRAVATLRIGAPPDPFPHDSSPLSSPRLDPPRLDPSPELFDARRASSDRGSVDPSPLGPSVRHDDELEAHLTHTPESGELDLLDARPASISHRALVDQHPTLLDRDGRACVD